MHAGTTSTRHQHPEKQSFPIPQTHGRSGFVPAGRHFSALNIHNSYKASRVDAPERFGALLHTLYRKSDPANTN